MKISVEGKAVTLTCSNITKKHLDQFMSNSEADGFVDLHDKSKNSFVVQGVFDDGAQVMVDGEPWNSREGLIDLMTDFHLIGEPMQPLIPDSAKTGSYWFMTTEIEYGSFFAIDVENFDEQKLVLQRKVYEMPTGEEYQLITASYDGTPLNYDDPDCENIENSLFDSEGNVIE
jgi:hypothetical protein